MLPPRPATRAPRPFARMSDPRIKAVSMSEMAPHVVIGGACCGGLATASMLKGTGVDVTVIDKNNCRLFVPLLYQVATAELSPGDIAEPVRKILRKHANIEVLMAEV